MPAPLKNPISVFSRIAAGVCLAFAGCSSVPNEAQSRITPVGENTYRIVREAGTGFTRDAEKLEEEARAEAEKFCADRGKKMKTITVSQHRPLYTLGFASAEITFQALDPEDPALRTSAPLPTSAGIPAPENGRDAVPSAASASTTPTDDLYAELLKLDDLRKRGILTEKEFQAEKKKLLQRSK